MTPPGNLDPYDPSTYFDDVPMGDAGSSKEKVHDPTVTDGTYRARVYDAGVFVGKNTQQFHCSWYFEILDGEHAGKLIQRFMTIDPQRVPRVKRDFTVVSGRDTEPVWDDLYDKLGNHTGPIRQEVMNAVVEVTQKTKEPKPGTSKIYVDVYIDKLIEGAPGKVYAQADGDNGASLASAPSDGVGILPAGDGDDFDENLF